MTGKEFCTCSENESVHENRSVCAVKIDLYVR